MKIRKKLYLISIAVAVVSMLVVVFVGCSGGKAAPSSATVSGVAAAGAPIIGNAYLKDSANHAIGPVSIGADGSFSFNVTGLTPPFYLLAVGYVGSPTNGYTLFSATTSSGIANINPLTNTVVAAAAGGIDPVSAYVNPATYSVTKTSLDNAITNLQAMLGPLLVAYNAEHVNPISDSFRADHTKLDAVFDLIAITLDSSGGDVTVTVTDNLTEVVIAQASTGDLGTPTISLPPQNTPLVMPKGADRLVATQNSDGGWEWENPDTDPATHLPSPDNTLGVTAQGLLDAYRISKKSVYLNACINTYNRMVINAADKGPDPQKHRMRGPDITFLVELSEVTGDQKYAAFAKNQYKAAVDEFAIVAPHAHTATGFAEFIRDRRKSNGLPALISWDINLYIQGALALNRYYPGQGFDADARSMAEVIYNSLYVVNDFDFTVTNQNSYWLSHTGAIEAFTTTGLRPIERDSLKSALVASQQLDGHFPENGGDSVLQTTAYAVMALLKAGENDAAKNGVKYLVNRQSAANGKWIESDNIEYTESSSEAIHAIYAFKK